ncbi:MAG: hypothetical protein LBF54_04315 [Holosporaceae bacterium]|jgi:hypothetical protein|nr:hypothetical protein [Holosporaceae bacterium]
MNFRGIVKCASSACCAAVMMCGVSNGMSDEGMMTAEKHCSGNSLQDVQPLNGSLSPNITEEELNKLKHHSLGAGSILNVRDTLSDDDLKRTLAHMVFCSKFARQRKGVDLGLFHGEFMLLFTKHWEAIRPKIDDEIWSSMKFILPILADAIREPFVLSSDYELIKKISSIAGAAMDDIEELKSDQFSEAVQEYAQFLEENCRQELIKMGFHYPADESWFYF